MKNTAKILFISLLSGLAAITGLVGYGFYAMEIEDHYGTLEVAFYKAKDHDIIINNKTKEFGIIDKNWKRIQVVNQKNETIDLYNWVYEANDDVGIKIYRPNHKVANVQDLSFSQLQNQLENENLDFVLHIYDNGKSTTTRIETTQ